MLIVCIVAFMPVRVWADSKSGDAETANRLPYIHLSQDGAHFVIGTSGKAFIPWGFNYDHDDRKRLLENYWLDEWPTIEKDFEEMKSLGANVVRIHLQLGKFMSSPDRPNWQALNQLARVLALAERTGLHLDITGLGCYIKQDIPELMNSINSWTVRAAWSTAISVFTGVRPRPGTPAEKMIYRLGSWPHG
jgi:hypothetical protein